MDAKQVCSVTCRVTENPFAGSANDPALILAVNDALSNLPNFRYAA